MTFNSLAFAVFLPIVLGVYYMLTRRAQNLWLLAASLVFYGWWDPRFLLLLAFSASIDFYAAARMSRDGVADAARKRWLMVSLVSNLTILGFFKYYGFFLDSTQALLANVGWRIPAPALQVILPIGISFYTFQAISYTIDVYRRVIPPSKDFVAFALSVCYFPHLVAGPIQRASYLLPQLESPRRVRWLQVREGAGLILFGLFKKVGVADALAPTVDMRFTAPHLYAGSDLLFAAYLFAIQIYCDFSGYSDIARGVSKLFGIELMLNFDHPYFSTSITEFWRRWHISLSTWLREYLYIPLGGNRYGVRKTYRNLIVTMLLGGLWHGANWTFVVWGGLHGIYLAVHKLMLGFGGASDRADATDHPLVALLKGLATFHLVCLAWIFFRASSVPLAFDYIGGILSWRPAEGEIEALNWLGLRTTSVIALLLAVEVLQYRADEHTPFLNWHWVGRAGLYAALVVLTLVFGGVDVDVPFIYFQF